MWWLWPYFKRVWAGAGTIGVGLVVSYLFALIGRQSVPMHAKIYNWFTQGFDTFDRKEAQALLDELEG